MPIRKLCTILIIIAFLFNYTTIFAAMQPPVLESESAVLMYASSGQLIYNQNGKTPYSPAGLTKIMTCLAAAEKNPINSIVTVGNTYNIPNEPAIGFKQGEQIELQWLLYCTIVANANDSAMIMAEYTSGTVDEFVSLMNQRAQELGCVNTVFKNPTGTQDAEQHTTAEDMALIVKAAITNPTVLSVLKTAQINIPKTNLSESRYYRSSNYLISSFIENKYINHDVQGGKTGHIPNEGYSLASFANVNSRVLIAIVFGGQIKSNLITSFTDTNNLYDYGFKGFKTANVADIGSVAYELKLSHAKDTDFVSLTAATSLKAMISTDDTNPVFEKNFNIADSPPLPIIKGDIMGSVTFTYNGVAVGTINLLAANNVDPNWFYTLRNWLDIVWSIVWLRWIIIILGSLILLYLIFVPRLARKYSR